VVKVKGMVRNINEANFLEFLRNINEIIPQYKTDKVGEGNVIVDFCIKDSLGRKAFVEVLNKHYSKRLPKEECDFYIIVFTKEGIKKFTELIDPEGLALEGLKESQNLLSIIVDIYNQKLKQQEKWIKCEKERVEKEIAETLRELYAKILELEKVASNFSHILNLLQQNGMVLEILKKAIEHTKNNYLVENKEYLAQWFKEILEDMDKVHSKIREIMKYKCPRCKIHDLFITKKGVLCPLCGFKVMFEGADRGGQEKDGKVCDGLGLMLS